MKTIKTFLKSTIRIQFIITLILLTLITGCSKDDDVFVQEEIELSNEKRITSFIFLLTNNPIDVNVIATINEESKTINAFVPPGTVINGLLPEINISPNASINIEIAQDFTESVSYIVTAEDGTTAIYVVTVEVALSQRDVLQAILDANPNHTIDWNLGTTEDLGDLTGVTTNIEDQIIELELAGKGLVSIPQEINQLNSLTNLSLFQNQISSLPQEIGQLSNLISLSLGLNQLSVLPAEIGQLTNLESLSFIDNQLTAIPSSIGQLTNLSYLSFAKNQLTAIPAEIGQLTNLGSLYLHDNQLNELPLEIGQLVNLKYLSLNKNELSVLPAEIGQLTNLIELLLFTNELTSLPPEIGFLINLSFIECRNNNFTSIPQAICNLESYHNITIFKDQQVSCITLSVEDALIQFSSANPGNTLDWGVDNYPGVTFNSISNPTDITLNNKNLTRIPEDISVFGDLEGLNINSNNIASFPEVSINLNKLAVITAASNNLSTVPDSFELLSSLVLLSLTNNPISSIPQGVCDLQVSNGGILTILTDPGEGCM